MAVYTLKNRSTGEIRHTTDWGRAGTTGLWSDVDRFKTPNLRGLASRGPFFHNGIAARCTRWSSSTSKPSASSSTPSRKPTWWRS